MDYKCILNFFFSSHPSRWNQLDTMIVVLSIAGIVMEKMKSGHILPINPTLIRVMRVLRIARGKETAPFRTFAFEDVCTDFWETSLLNSQFDTLQCSIAVERYRDLSSARNLKGEVLESQAPVQCWGCVCLSFSPETTKNGERDTSAIGYGDPSSSTSGQSGKSIYIYPNVFKNEGYASCLFSRVYYSSYSSSSLPHWAWSYSENWNVAKNVRVLVSINMRISKTSVWPSSLFFG